MHSSEDAFILACCRRRLHGGPVPAAPADWDRLVRRAETNRLAPLLFRVLEAADALDAMPSSAREGLKGAYTSSFKKASLFLRELGAVLEAFRDSALPVLVLRGPALGQAVYGDVALRPFTDIDLFVTTENVSKARACLEQAGCAPAHSRHRPEYFEKYHLHLLYTRPPSHAAFELHWALDHPYMPYTIDAQAVFEGHRDAGLSGMDARLPVREKNLVCNAVHLVKHACFLRYERDRASVQTQLLNSGSLILLFDMALEIERSRNDMDWDLVARRSREWNTVREVGLALRWARELFDCAGPLPQAGETARVSLIERAAYRFATGRRASLQQTRPEDMFRPIRALDLVRYLVPGRRYLEWRYGARSAAAAILLALLHPCIACTQLLSNLLANLRRGRRGD